jgi:hypothetical protein
MEIIMLTIRKSHVFRLAVTCIFVFFLVLSCLIQIGQASTPHQTIPTAPPSTASIPTILPTETPTKPPQTTVISTQPTHLAPSQTPSSTGSPTIEIIISSPSIAASTTAPSGNGPVPQLTVTQTPTEVILISPTISKLPITTVFTPAIITGTSGILYYLLGGGIIIIFLIGIAWFLKFKRR